MNRRGGWQLIGASVYDAVNHDPGDMVMNLIHAAFEPAGGGPHPALVALHGWGSNALDLLGLAPHIGAGRFMMICPQGRLEVPMEPLAGYGWFSIRYGMPPNEAELDDAAQSTLRFIDAAVERYPIDRRKLALLGFSQGGLLAYWMAVTQPERFAALASISTWCPPELVHRGAGVKALAQLPTLVQHGRADSLIEIPRARESVERLRQLRLPLTFREYDCGHEISNQMLRDLSEFLAANVLSPAAIQ